MMKRIRFLLTGLLLIMGSSLVSAQDDWNPSNPPEPAVKYKVTTSASPSSCYASGGGSYSPGQQIWINTSSYSSGYRFLYWTKNGEQYSEQQSFNYTVEEQDVAFVAYYEYNPANPAEPDGVLSYRLYLNTNLPGCCSFNRGSGDKVKVGETVGLNAYLNQGYKFLGWYLGDELLSESTWYNYEMPANDVTLTAMVEYSPDNPGDPPSNRPLTPIVTVKNCERVYGDANPVFEYVKNKEFAGEPVITCEADASSPVGTYTIKIERGTIENDSVVLVGGTLTINKAPLTISAGYYSRVYGDDNPSPSPSYSGFKNGESNEVLTTQPSLSWGATKETPVGETTVDISGADAVNYEISYVGGTLTITKAPLTIKAGEYTKKQGDDNPTFAPEYEGFKNSDNADSLSTKPTVSCDATKSSPVGEYVITVSGAESKNYVISYVNGKLTIKAMTFVSGGDDDKDEDDAAVYQITTLDEANPTVSIAGSEGVKGKFGIPETVEYNGVIYTVTEIVEGAFENNNLLTDIIIPATITSIKDRAFKGCSNLKTITVYIVTPITLQVASTRAMMTRADGASIFEGVDKETCILYVPEGSVELYKAANVWKDFVNILAIGSTGMNRIVLTSDNHQDVYDLYGRKVKSKTTSFEGLQNGVYIIKGKKQLIKR